MLLLVAFVFCEEKHEEEDKASVCLFVGNERHCHHVENAAELKAELEKSKGDGHNRVARHGNFGRFFKDPVPNQPRRILG